MSEENDDPIIVEEAYRGEYCVVMDPLDGSSNIDCGVSIGTIFGIYRVQPGSSGTAEDVLRVGILNLNPLRHADIILQMFKFGMYKDEAYPFTPITFFCGKCPNLSCKRMKHILSHPSALFWHFTRMSCF